VTDNCAWPSTGLPVCRDNRLRPRLPPLPAVLTNARLIYGIDGQRVFNMLHCYGCSGNDDDDDDDDDDDILNLIRNWQQRCGLWLTIYCSNLFDSITA